MLSSGTTAIATSGSGNVTAISATTIAGRVSFRNVRVVNEGSTAGFYSLDGGTTWARLSASSIDVKRELTNAITSVLVKRDVSDLSAVYCEVW
jgi:photosystem II stability/assembly factor-like uncharacterized protein